LWSAGDEVLMFINVSWCIKTELDAVEVEAWAFPKQKAFGHCLLVDVGGSPWLLLLMGDFFVV
jgi:hypothetical protein